MKAETPHWFVADNGQRLVAATGADRLVTTIKKAFACVSVPGSIKQNPLEGSNMLLLSVSPKDSQEWFVHRKVRHIPGGYIWGFPGGQEIALRITYRSQTCRPETAYYREAAAWLSEKTRNKLIHICSPGYSKTVSKTDLERALFEALQAAVAWDAAEHSDDMGRRAT